MSEQNWRWMCNGNCGCEDGSLCHESVCGEALDDDSSFTTELTPEGEQYVIPGAEKRTTAKKPQGELFG